MATKKNTAPDDERVELTIPRGGEREDPNLFIGVNGVGYLLPRGRKSRVPAAVAEEYRRSERARDAMDAARSALVQA